MKQLVFILISVLFGHAALADLPEQTLSVKDIKADRRSSPRQRAERMARVGEALLMPQSLDYALEVFTEALRLDRQNVRAGFYVHMFAPLYTLKGYMSRVQPLVDATKEDAFIQSYYRSLNHQWPFFRGEQKDITTDRQMRELLAQLGEAWGAARQYLATATTPLELRTVWIDAEYHRTREEPVMIWEWRDGAWVKRPNGETRAVDQKVDGLDQAARFCTVDQPEPGVYHVAACPHLTVRPYTLDFADIEALRGYAAGHQLLGYLDTAYNTDGLMKLAGRGYAAFDKGDRLSDIDVALTLIQANAGALESDHKLARVPDLGTDIFGGVKWLMRFQDDLCAPRPDFVFTKGICLTGKGFDDGDLKKALAMTEATLAASPIDAANGRGFRTQVRMHRIYDAPVANLRQVAPNLFNLKGQATALPDNTLNNIFPNADAHQFYRLGSR